MNVDRLRARAMAAMGHKDLAWILREVPAAYRDDPRVIRHLLLSALDGDPALGDGVAFREAETGLRELADVRAQGAYRQVGNGALDLRPRKPG